MATYNDRHSQGSSTLFAPLTGKAKMEARSAEADTVEDIVRQAQAGDSSAFGRLYEMYYDQIHRYVAFKCGNQLEAEDLTGEVFLKMIESINKFKFKGFPFTSWLYRIAHNTVIDNFRRKGRRPTVPLDDFIAATTAGESDLERHAEVSWTMREVVRAMEDLTDLQREVITLRFAGGLSVAETASAVGRKENAVKALQHAGIRKLRQIMSPPQPVAVPSPELEL
jgi:RNA polymerase sigma-70 factor (ECF subfamily)